MFNLPKIITAKQTRDVDQYTIATEPISSTDLMERASIAFTEALIPHLSPGDKIAIVCGPGNNGGDGLAVARLLSVHPYNIDVYTDTSLTNPSKDYEVNSKRLPSASKDITELTQGVLNDYPIIIDAIFGTGISRPITGKWQLVIEAINQCSAAVFSIDLPSGMIPDQLTLPETVVQSKLAFSFQRPKRAFLFPDSQNCLKHFEILDIGLDEAYIDQQDSNWYWLTEKITDSRPERMRFSHKGTYGHALMVAGAQQTMGAAILSTKAALRSGVGLVSVKCPSNLQMAINISCPEAMMHTDGNYSKYTSIGVGPGLGTDSIALQKLTRAIEHTDKLVIDADGINLLAQNPDLLDRLPNNTILTPHPKELERLMGKWTNASECLNRQQAFSQKYQCIIVAKNAHTVITTPTGQVFINTNGNAGMAKGGSGDVLTGLITGLLAQSLSPELAACLGVYLHANAGDRAKDKFGMDGMKAGDLIDGIN